MVKKILLVGDLFLDNVYSKIRIKDILISMKFEVDLIRIDSFDNINKKFYINEPSIFNENLFNEIKNSYNIIILSIIYEDMRFNNFINFDIDYYFEKYKKLINLLLPKCCNIYLIIPPIPLLSPNDPYNYLEQEISECFSNCEKLIKNLATYFSINIINMKNTNEEFFICKTENLLNDTFNYKLCLFIKKSVNETSRKTIFKIH